MPASNFDYAIIRVVPRVERDEFLNADKYLESTPKTEAPATPALPAGASSEAPASGTSETAFEREMREARERLRET